MRVLLNDAEFDALAGLPHVVVCLYVMAIRPRMDYVTGMVGISPFISWQALTEWLYIEPKPGIKGGSPSREAVRRAAQQLVRAGLVKIRSNVCNAQLIFQLPRASLYSHVQNKADIKPTPEADRGRQRGKHAKGDRGEKGKADTHLSTPVPTNNHHHNNNDHSAELLWPDGLTPIERSAMLALLTKSKCNGSSQLLLDEIAGVMRTKPVYNKAGYLRTLIERWNSGDFIPERADKVRAAREHASSVADQPPHPRATPTGRAQAQMHIKNLKSIVRK